MAKGAQARMPLTPDELNALNAEREAARADADNAITPSRDTAVQALEAFYQAERRQLIDPWNTDNRAAADQARTAYTTARQAFRDALTTATQSIQTRVQAKINELTAT